VHNLSFFFALALSREQADRPDNKCWNRTAPEPERKPGNRAPKVYNGCADCVADGNSLISSKEKENNFNAFAMYVLVTDDTDRQIKAPVTNVRIYDILEKKVWTIERRVNSCTKVQR
jgi:hypothetical protein